MAFWSVIEVSAAVVSACLPTLHPLYMYLFKNPSCISSLRSRLSKVAKMNTTARSFVTVNVNKPRYLLSDPFHQRWGPETVRIRTAITAGNADVERADALPNQILVRFQLQCSVILENYETEDPTILPIVSRDHVEQGR